ncbi:hypothetical protein LX36DRAFT_223250 [Colletotrichum falcatum]|nr:hypothetical protein LX36DRAFT_223250 [Colletotrichum falcatum]
METLVTGEALADLIAVQPGPPLSHLPPLLVNMGSSPTPSCTHTNLFFPAPPRRVFDSSKAEGSVEDPRRKHLPNYLEARCTGWYSGRQLRLKLASSSEFNMTTLLFASSKYQTRDDKLMKMLRTSEIVGLIAALVTPGGDRLGRARRMDLLPALYKSRK